MRKEGVKGKRGGEGGNGGSMGAEEEAEGQKRW